MNAKLLVMLGFLAVSLVFLLVAVTIPLSVLPGYLKIVLLIVSLVFDVMAFSSRYYSYLIIPMLQQRGKNVVLSNEQPYWLSATEDAIIKKDKTGYTATVYINIPLYKSATDMTDEERLEFSRQVSRLAGISREPIRFTTQMYMMNKDSYIQSIRDAISAAENEEAELMQKDADQNSLEIVKGKLSMWRNVLESVSKISSLELSTYATLSATGIKEYEAIAVAQQKAREAMSGIGSVLGVTPSIITGKDMLRFVEPEYLIPFSTISQEMTEKVEEEVI